MSKEKKVILNDKYAKHQIKHMKNLLDMVEHTVNNAIESSSNKYTEIHRTVIQDNLSILKEEAILFKGKAFCEVEIDNDETNQ